MTVEEVFKILESEVAPVGLSDEFCAKCGGYDNSGIIINCGKAVSGVLFSLDLSIKAAKAAISCGYNLIVTHHPAIYGGITKIDITSSAQSRAIALCIANGISVISMHLNFDCAPQGIDYYLMKGLGGESALYMNSLSSGAYGRVYPVQPTSCARLLKRVKSEFKTNRAHLFGNAEKEVTKVASFCGAGLDEEAAAFAKKACADVVVSSDLKHHLIVELVASGIAVIQLTHYCSEAYGFGKIYNKIKNMLQAPSSFFFDEELA